MRSLLGVSEAWETFIDFLKIISPTLSPLCHFKSSIISSERNLFLRNTILSPIALHNGPTFTALASRGRPSGVFLRYSPQNCFSVQVSLNSCPM